MIVEVQYWCSSCDTKFVSYHEEDYIGLYCNWCNGYVEPTGQIRKIEGDEIVTYLQGKEVFRERKIK